MAILALEILGTWLGGAVLRREPSPLTGPHQRHADRPQRRIRHRRPSGRPYHSPGKKAWPHTPQFGSVQNPHPLHEAPRGLSLFESAGLRTVVLGAAVVLSGPPMLTLRAMVRSFVVWMKARRIEEMGCPAAAFASPANCPGESLPQGIHPAYFTMLPSAMSFSVMMMARLPSAAFAARSIPRDSWPISFAGSRLTTTTTFFPMRSSGL